MKTTLLRIFLVICILPSLQGCPAILFTGAVASATVVHDRRTAGTVLEDESIELKALQEISADEDLNKNTHCIIVSYNTVVLVTGEVPNQEMRNRVIELLRRIPKVSKLHDELSIAAPSSVMSRSSDTVITSKVKSRLLASNEVKGLLIKVVTDKGVVYLMGMMKRGEADIATDLTRTVSGVQKVVRLFEYID